jgi:hypothetical protein
MTLHDNFNPALQVIVTLLIFVAGYLALVICTVVGLVIAELISERGCVARAYSCRSDSLDAGGRPSNADDDKEATEGPRRDPKGGGESLDVPRTDILVLM